jgi:hypothetical protein
MLSPNIGLTKGRDATSAALAATKAMQVRRERQNNLVRIIRLQMVVSGQWAKNKPQAAQRKFFNMDKALDEPLICAKGR